MREHKVFLERGRHSTRGKKEGFFSELEMPPTTNNHHQVPRAAILNLKLGLSDATHSLTKYVVADTQGRQYPGCFSN